MTPPDISVIIPTVKPDTALEALLGQLKDMDIAEIIIVRPENTPVAFKISENCKWLTAPKGRGSQIQAGLDIAKGDILWILHDDSVLPQSAVSEVHRINQNPFAALGCFPLKFSYSSISLKLFSAFSYLKTPLTTFGDQGFFFHREYKDDLPSLTPYPLLEDVVLYQELRKKGRVVKANCAITTDPKRFLRLGIWHTQWRNAVTLWKFHKGVSAQQLYEDYYKAAPRMRSVTSLSEL